MKKEKFLQFDEFCIETIRERLEEMEGFEVYGGDLSSCITEIMECNGTFTYSTKEAEEYMEEWRWECGEFFKFIQNEFDKCPLNPFHNPEAYLVAMVREGVTIILSQSETLNECWNDEIEITEEFTQQLMKEIEENEYKSGF